MLTKVQPFLSLTEPYTSLSLLKFPQIGLSLELVTTVTEVTQALFGLLYHLSEQLVVYRELYCSKVTASDLADMVLEAEAEDGTIRYGVLDSSLWHKRGDTGPSLAEQMNHEGLSMASF